MLRIVDWLVGEGTEHQLWPNADDSPVSPGGSLSSQHKQLGSLRVAAHPCTHTASCNGSCKVTFAAAAAFSLSLSNTFSLSLSEFFKKKNKKK